MGHVARAAAAVLLAVVAGAGPRAFAAGCPSLRFAAPRQLVALTGNDIGSQVRVVDVDRDGREDLVLFRSGGLADRVAVSVAFQQPDGSFVKSDPLYVETPYPWLFDVAIGDFDGDGAPDVLLVEGTALQLLRAAAGGALQLGPVSRPSAAIGAHAVADLDGDGRSELIATVAEGVQSYEMDDSGAFHERLLAAPAGGPFNGAIVVGDFDGDGHQDLLLVHQFHLSEPDVPSILWGDGHGGISGQASPSFDGIDAVISVSAVDLDGDGRADLVAYASTARFTRRVIAVARSRGRTGFAISELATVTTDYGAGQTLLAGDFDGDGLVDLAVGSSVEPPRTLVYRNAGGGSLGPVDTLPLFSRAIADLDGDGRPDLVGTDGFSVFVARNLCGTSSSLPDLVVPALVSTTGANGERYETELTLEDVGATPLALELRYVPSVGGGGGTATVLLGASPITLSPALDRLAALGIPIPPSGERVGTLQIRVLSGPPSDLVSTARVVSAAPGGHATVAFSGTEARDARTLVVPWLVEDGADRSNLAVMSAGGAAEGDVTLRVTLVSAEDSSEHALAPVRLAPGGWYQWNRVLSDAGLRNGWARVERVDGTAPFFAYGVVNDERTGDGSFVRAIATGRVTHGFTIPAVVESARYESDLVVTNASSQPRELTLVYVAGAAGGRTTTSLYVQPGSHLYLRGVVDQLRGRRVAGIGPKGPSFVGPLFVAVGGGGSPGGGDPVSDLFVGVRTRSAGGFGVYYDGVPYEYVGTEDALIPGVRQDASTRTNIGVVSLGCSGEFTVRALDPATRAVVAERTVVVDSYGWGQVDSILRGTGVSDGLVRVTPPCGVFLAYGILNDGAEPGSGTDDGAYLAAR
jgi:hypothetical protein